MHPSSCSSPASTDVTRRDPSLVDRLGQSALFREYREAFEETTGLPLAVRAAHIGEDLHLSDVARAAGMSPYHPCKVFHRETGATFTEYIARTRVETVKCLLLNPHTRVSEAAYEAGIQSLSQFNRVFRRITGEAPSAFQDRIHKTPGRSLAIAA
jgi:AraC-like DNA-binding protein